MKKIIVALLAAAVFAVSVFPFAVFAGGSGEVAAVQKSPAAEVTRNPVERTFPRGSDLVYTVEGENVTKFEWHLIYNGEDCELTKANGVNRAKELGKNPSGDAAQEVIGADSGTLRLKGFWFPKEANVQVTCVLTGANNAGVVVGPVAVRLMDTVDDTLQPPDIKMKANVFARQDTIIKLACSVQDPEGFTYDAYQYTWFVLENGKEKEIPDEEGSILVVNQDLGRREYKCRVTAIVSGTRIEHETMWTSVEIYVPSVKVSYPDRNVTLKAGKTAKIDAEYEVFRPVDEGKVTFQWYKSDKADGVYKKVDGATDAELELKGAEEACEEYYFCIVANEPYYQNREGDLEGTRYESVFDSLNVVKVVHKGGSAAGESGDINLFVIIFVVLGVVAVMLLAAVIVLLVVLLKRKK